MFIHQNFKGEPLSTVNYYDDTNTVLDNPIISQIFKYFSFSNENDGGNGGAISAGINSAVVSNQTTKFDYLFNFICYIFSNKNYF